MRKGLAIGMVLFTCFLQQSRADEFFAYRVGVEDAVRYLVTYTNRIPERGWWVIADVTSLSLPQVVLLMKLGEGRTGVKPAFLWRAGRDYIVFLSAKRKGDAEGVVEDLESYGVKGLKVKKVGEEERSRFKPRIVKRLEMCRYPEYRGVSGIKSLLKQTMEIASTIEDPAFNRNAFIEDVSLMIMKLEEYEKRGRMGGASVPQRDEEIRKLLEEATRW